MTDQPEILTPCDGNQTLPGQGLGFAATVEHPVDANKPNSTGPGQIIVSPVVAPNSSAIMVQVQHEDGTVLAFFLDEVSTRSLQYALVVSTAKLREILNVQPKEKN